VRDGEEKGEAGQAGAEQERRLPNNEVLEQWGRRVGRFFGTAAARVREEAEDILAEAQSIRRGERD
jgi:hypothetical protein